MVAAFPSGALHLADLPWRFSSPSARDPDRTCLWEDAGGRLVAWVVLQFPWHCLDFEIRPDARSETLETSILTWAVDRLKVEAADRGAPLPFYASARISDTMRVTALQRAGFAPDGWDYVRMVRPIDNRIPETATPEGFHIRPLAGEADIEAYVATHRAAFDSANMTVEWRRATLNHPLYSSDLDLVAVAPDGTLAAFCVSWIMQPLMALGEAKVAQIEPLGVLPEYQRHGLGRALLLEALRRARAVGATWMEVDAESYNEASVAAYESVGFRPQYHAPFFTRGFG